MIETQVQVKTELEEEFFGEPVTVVPTVKFPKLTIDLKVDNYDKLIEGLGKALAAHNSQLRSQFWEHIRSHITSGDFGIPAMWLNTGQSHRATALQQAQLYQGQFEAYSSPSWCIPSRRPVTGNLGWATMVGRSNIEEK